MPSFSLHLSGAPETGFLEDMYIRWFRQARPLPKRRRSISRNEASTRTRRSGSRLVFLLASRIVAPTFDWKSRYLYILRSIRNQGSNFCYPGSRAICKPISADVDTIFTGSVLMSSMSRRDMLTGAQRRTHGELQVREYARDQDQAVTIFLDLDTSDLEWFERAVDCCAFLVWRLAERGVRIHFITQRWAPEDAGVYDILKYLAVVEPHRGLKPSIPHEHTLQIALSTRPNESASTSRPPALPPSMAASAPPPASTCKAAGSSAPARFPEPEQHRRHPGTRAFPRHRHRQRQLRAGQRRHADIEIGGTNRHPRVRSGVRHRRRDPGRHAHRQPYNGFIPTAGNQLQDHQQRRQRRDQRHLRRAARGRDRSPSARRRTRSATSAATATTSC